MKFMIINMIIWTANVSSPWPVVRQLSDDTHDTVETQ